MKDINGGHVQIEVRSDGKVLWVNVNGILALRIQRFASLEIKDERKKKNRAGRGDRSSSCEHLDYDKQPAVSRNE